MKKKCLKVFSAAFALCLAFGVGNLLTASADGDEVVYVEGDVAKVGFYVQNGAAVHLGDTTTGIKYTTVVTKAFQDYLTSAYEGATFEWHTLITGTNMLEGGDVTKVTPDLKKPDWVGENKGEAACENFTQTLENMTDNAQTGEVADVDKDGEIDQKYEAAITYEHLLGDEKASASNADLIARSYVKITQGEEETIIYSAAEDTVRNMKAIAYAAIKSGDYAEDEDNLFGYTGVTSKDVVTNKTVDSFYSLNDESSAITVEGLDTEACEVYYGAKKLTSSVSGGVVTVSGMNGLEAGEDKEYELTVFANGKIYDQAFGCATKVIDEANDLDVFNLNMTNYAEMAKLKTANSSTAESKIVNELMPTVTGYYVLAKDIDASKEGYAMQTQGYISRTHNTAMNERGFQGTFDGRGHTISGLTLGTDMKLPTETRTDWWRYNTYSLFGVIGKGGTVKNFALTDVRFDLTNSGDGGSITFAYAAPIAQWVVSGATVENVYVGMKGVNSFSDQNTRVSGFAQCVDVEATLKNIVVDDTYVVTEGDDLVDTTKAANESKTRGSFVYRKQANNTKTENNWTNVVVISQRALAATNETNEYDASNITDLNSGYVAMPNTYRYESVGAWKTEQSKDATKPNVNDFGTDYWRLVDGVPVWGKATA